MGVSASCGGDEFDCGVLAGSFDRGVHRVVVCNSFGKRFFCVCGAWTGAADAGRGGAAGDVADFALDVPAQDFSANIGGRQPCCLSLEGNLDGLERDAILASNSKPCPEPRYS